MSDTPKPFDLSEFEGKRFSMVFANDGQRVHTGRIVNGALAYDDKEAAATALVEVRATWSNPITYLGKAEVHSVFRSTKFGNIAGVRITDGVVRADGWVRIVRDGVPVVGPHRVHSLRQYKNDREEVGVGQECGIGLDDRVQVGDVLVFGADVQ